MMTEIFYSCTKLLASNILRTPNAFPLWMMGYIIKALGPIKLFVAVSLINPKMTYYYLTIGLKTLM